MVQSSSLCRGSAKQFIHEVRRIFLVVSLLMPATDGTIAVAQLPATLQGVVRDAASGEPLRGARVSVLGSAVATHTDQLGRYELREITAGQFQLRIECTGYTTLVEQVDVHSRGVTVMDFEVASLFTMLEHLVVQGSEGRGASSADTATTILELEDRYRPSLGNALDPLPGVEMLRSNGQVGSGIRVRLRGARSLILGGDPLVYIDGIRVQNTTSGVPSSGVAALGVLDMIDPSKIERVEILRGPSATAMYGTGAANGVILIITKQGAGRGAPR